MPAALRRSVRWQIARVILAHGTRMTNLRSAMLKCC